MTRVTGLLTASGTGSYFYDDQAAIRAGARPDGAMYKGTPVTPGFAAIRMPASALSLGLVLDDGSVAWGDAVSVQYSGAGGRDPVFRPEREAEAVGAISAWVVGREVEGFRDLSAAFHDLGDHLKTHTALRYGVTQALLRAVAYHRATTMAEVVAHEYGQALAIEGVPIFAQSGADRRIGVDRMIMKRVDELPHGLISSPEAFGRDGETFLEYVAWTAARIRHLGDADYEPVLHFDVYGLPGLTFDGDIAKVAVFLGRVEAAAGGLRVRLEAPVDFGGVAAQIEGYRRLLDLLDAAGCSVEVVADEWCDSLADIRAFAQARAAHMVHVKLPDLAGIDDAIEGLLELRQAGVGAYLGGSCTETNLSAEVSVHLAVALQPDVQLAKPGMGIDEAVMMTRNTQNRLLAELESKRTRVPGAVT